MMLPRSGIVIVTLPTNSPELISYVSFLSSTVAIAIPSETARMAMAIVATGPALIVFPFFQKYFVKGLTVGSVKG